MSRHKKRTGAQSAPVHEQDNGHSGRLFQPLWVYCIRKDVSLQTEPTGPVARLWEMALKREEAHAAEAMRLRRLAAQEERETERHRRIRKAVGVVLFEGVGHE